MPTSRSAGASIPERGRDWNCRGGRGACERDPEPRSALSLAPPRMTPELGSKRRPCSISALRRPRVDDKTLNRLRCGEP
ncbi:hypothetical protein HPG69_014360 [Diceros bicornis minor]|uniref:Uncharacterized protein n=1 Tax=Diceros bicornis minor TaxID=77932 RepID=A0A7J7EWM0_DICBM|nr:hypothetical protein HPG69_014360 [Diceros bicornis minor]